MPTTTPRSELIRAFNLAKAHEQALNWQNNPPHGWSYHAIENSGEPFRVTVDDKGVRVTYRTPDELTHVGDLAGDHGSTPDFEFPQTRGRCECPKEPERARERFTELAPGMLVHKPDRAPAWVVGVLTVGGLVWLLAITGLVAVAVELFS
jgi:hypothetical protein